MLAKEREMEILQGAINAFKENVNLNLEIEIVAQDVAVTLDDEDKLRYRTRADCLLNFVFEQTQIHFYAEIKTNITQGEIALKRMFPKGQDQFLLVTKYVPGQQADRLKKNNIQFIDMAGNVFINQLPLYIFVKGNRLPEGLKPVPVKRAFKPTGLKLIFAFLCNPGLENRPYREIAKKANVALGTVGWVMRDLKELEYLINRVKKGKQLIGKEDLLKRWIIDYAEQLKPKLLLGRFRGTPDWWKNITLDADKAQWGGEVAAAKLNQYPVGQSSVAGASRSSLGSLPRRSSHRRGSSGARWPEG